MRNYCSNSPRKQLGQWVDKYLPLIPAPVILHSATWVQAYDNCITASTNYVIVEKSVHVGENVTNGIFFKSFMCTDPFAWMFCDILFDKIHFDKHIIKLVNVFVPCFLINILEVIPQYIKEVCIVKFWFFDGFLYMSSQFKARASNVCGNCLGCYGSTPWITVSRAK